jgi:hypothetical protein
MLLSIQNAGAKLIAKPLANNSNPKALAMAERMKNRMNAARAKVQLAKEKASKKAAAATQKALTTGIRKSGVKSPTAKIKQATAPTAKIKRAPTKRRAQSESSTSDR